MDQRMLASVTMIPVSEAELRESFVNCSKGEAKRSIEGGGIYVNQERVKDVAHKVAAADWIGGRNLLLRKGKKDYALLRR